MLNIVQITDLHLNESSSSSLTMGGQPIRSSTDSTLLATLDAIHHLPTQPDFLLVTGDVAQEPTAKTYQRLADLLHNIEIPCYFLPGNHDDYPLMQKHLNSNNFHTLTRASLGQWQILFLATNVINQPYGRLSKEALKELKKTLETYNHQHTLIAMHHHPVPIHSAWMDSINLQNAEEFLALLNAYPHVKAVTFGHIHQEFDEQHNGIRFLGSPSTCQQFVPNQKNMIFSDLPPGFRSIALGDTGELATNVHYIQAIK